MTALVKLGDFLQTYGGWGVAAVALVGWGWERRENRRLNTALLAESHTTTAVVERNDETWQTAIGLLRELRDRGRGGK